MSKRVRAGSKELRDLARRLPPGIALIADGKAKVRLVDPDGEVLRYADGRPIGMPNSPCASTVRDVERRLRREGLLT